MVVDDGSTDGTADAVREAAGGFPGTVRVLRHARNRGKTEALVTGAGATSRRWLVLFDADLQHSTEEIPRFLDRLAEGFDVVTGWKQGRYEKRSHPASCLHRKPHRPQKVTQRAQRSSSQSSAPSVPFPASSAANPSDRKRFPESRLLCACGRSARGGEGKAGRRAGSGLSRRTPPWHGSWSPAGLG